MPAERLARVLNALCAGSAFPLTGPVLWLSIRRSHVRYVQIEGQQSSRRSIYGIDLIAVGVPSLGHLEHLICKRLNDNPIDNICGWAYDLQRDIAHDHTIVI